MKLFRFTFLALLISLSASALAQSDAQKSFDKLKSLAGSWEGTYEGKPMQVSLRVTSMGNTLMHEQTEPGKPNDPITMFYVDGDRLLLTHYCDAGNRARMTGRVAPDGKTLDFDFLDVSNFSSNQFGHVQHVVITLLDADHHSEDWIFMVQGGGPPVHAHYDLQRSKVLSSKLK
jgi:hypothetical protein